MKSTFTIGGDMTVKRMGFGASSIAHLRENTAARDMTLTTDEMEQLEALAG